MGKEILAIPEENLAEVIKIIRIGLKYIGSDRHLPQISEKTREQLARWCDDEEEYLNGLIPPAESGKM